MITIHNQSLEIFLSLPANYSTLVRKRMPFENIDRILKEIEEFKIDSAESLEKFRIRFLGQKNVIKPLFNELNKLSKAYLNTPTPTPKDLGIQRQKINKIAENKFNEYKDKYSKPLKSNKEFPNDLTLPVPSDRIGSRHPVSLVMDHMIEIFQRIGFVVEEEREIEDDWHNFTAMNTPEDHPARDMQDTFYLKGSDNMLLRTHTSSVQARIMTKQKPPIRIIAPGRVYRNETISARSHCQFHQIEGLYVDKNVSFADMKQTLLYFAREVYGKDIKIRLRPSYFPFTEPSAEMDVYMGTDDEHSRRLTKGTGWLEVLGCGMVDPNVLENCGIDSTVYSGYAFGIGIERSAMQNYNINDIRQLFENDVRLLKQFRSIL
ncbi:MAG TPA: phenylalanine--tRNA ligase subunit alpha [Saprospiraceae bacterium]|nr:phenylalanine--tRNA ligase subunit alpha [Saprospiraceae bacterium]